MDVLDPRAIQIHTDGSCYMHRGRIAGCAAIVVYPEHLGLPESQIVDYGCAENTNIRMELMACAKALSRALESRPWDGVTCIYVITDLLFLANNHGNARCWKRNGWRTFAGVPVANEDLWDEILKSIAKLSRLGLRVDFHYNRGKSDEIGKKVHKAATVAAQRGGFDRDFGFAPGSYARSMVPGGAAAQRFRAKGQR